MATPKEAAEMLVSRSRLPRGKVKEASNITQSRSTNRSSSKSNSVENSPAKGSKSPPQGKKSPTTKQKSPAKKQKSPAKKPKSTNATQPPPVQIALHTEDASNEGNGEQRNKDNEASEREGDESDPDDEDDPGHKPDYKGRVVSYTDPDSERPGHGIVGDYIKGQGYHVLFKYTDDLEPSECVDHCPLHWITDTLVDEETANAWNTAMEDARLQDSPLSSRHKKATQLPAKRVREQIKRFEPETTTSNAKTRKAKKKQKASLGDGVSNVHLQSSISMYIFNVHL
jgi:hypothetical protein